MESLHMWSALLGGVTAAASVVGAQMAWSWLSAWRRRREIFAKLTLAFTMRGHGMEMYYDEAGSPGAHYAAPKNTYLYKEDILNFRVRDDDVWVLTYPKCGTTWTQEMVWMICHDADSALARSATIMDRFPMLDTPDGAEISRLAARASPRYIKSHLPLCLLPRGLLHSKAKIIYTVRNPKDTSISLYKFFQMMEIRHMDSSFEDFMFYFTEQTDGSGSYWDYTEEYLKMRDNPNMLLLKFEDMKKDLPAVIRKTAAFLDRRLTDDQVSRTAEHCSFRSMRDNAATNYGWMKDMGLFKKNSENFIREGKVGGWKAYYTAEMSARVDQLSRDHLQPHGLTFDYE